MDAALASAYEVLGVPPSAGDAELRAAYRRLVQLHHPDHNGGSAESARRFAAVQAAYARVIEQRRAAAAAAAGAPPGAAAGSADIEARLAALERELHAARQAAQAAARSAAAAAERSRRPTPEELGYITTDDSFTKIFDDAEAELRRRLEHAERSPLAKRLTDLFGGHDRDER